MLLNKEIIKLKNIFSNRDLRLTFELYELMNIKIVYSFMCFYTVVRNGSLKPEEITTRSLKNQAFNMRCFQRILDLHWDNIVIDFEVPGTMGNNKR